MLYVVISREACKCRPAEVVVLQAPVYGSFVDQDGKVCTTGRLAKLNDRTESKCRNCGAWIQVEVVGEVFTFHGRLPLRDMMSR